ncbi:MAG: hypothetical protein K5660_09490 [Paludibacteraceae bacterium]|nr:hypothetical protein [Paludibacteraceae bacterium]
MKQFDSETENIEVADDYKPTYIQEQHNTNCQQFFGPITNCTFTMPAAQPSPQSKPKAAKKTVAKKKTSDKPKTLKYYRHGNNGVLKKQRKRVDLVFRKFCDWRWIDEQTCPEDFDALFEGEPRNCNITWKANTTILTLLMQELLKQEYIANQTSQSASSMVKEQFGLTPNFDQRRLSDDDKVNIEITVYLLSINNPLKQQPDGGDNDFDTSDAALKEVLSGQLRITKGI